LAEVGDARQQRIPHSLDYAEVFPLPILTQAEATYPNTTRRLAVSTAGASLLKHPSTICAEPPRARFSEYRVLSTRAAPSHFERLSRELVVYFGHQFRHFSHNKVSHESA
jgi:hypothetical protein